MSGSTELMLFRSMHMTEKRKRSADRQELPVISYAPGMSEALMQ
jgi:hypothetical protein